MAYRYCEECGSGQDRITIYDISPWGYNDPVLCRRCKNPRSDDSPAERLAVIVEFLQEKFPQEPKAED